MRGVLTQREIGLSASVLVMLLLAVFLPETRQWSHYHDFADQRTLLGVPRALDVFTNAPFALMGLWGWWRLKRLGTSHWGRPASRLAGLFFGGLIVTALGSAWYHWAPDDQRLLVDRGAMSISFAALMGLAACERVSARAGQVLAGSALLLGLLSLLVWAQTGNLTPWAVFQGGGMLLVLGLMLCRVPAAHRLGIAWWAVLAIYGLAKVTEGMDAQLLASTDLISGHSLKHLLASLAAWPIIQALRTFGARPEHAPFKPA